MNNLRSMNGNDDVSQITALFGGQAALATALNVGTSAISNWKRARHIPERQKYRIAKLAQEKKVPLPHWFWNEQAAA